MSEVRTVPNDIFDDYFKCVEIAERLDACNPELRGAFSGTTSERIWRQLAARNLPLFRETEEPK